MFLTYGQSLTVYLDILWLFNANNDIFFQYKRLFNFITILGTFYDWTYSNEVSFCWLLQVSRSSMLNIWIYKAAITTSFTTWLLSPHTISYYNLYCLFLYCEFSLSTNCELLFFPCHFFRKSKKSVGNKELGLDMLSPEIKYSWSLKLTYDDDKICTFVISTVNTC